LFFVWISAPFALLLVGAVSARSDQRVNLIPIIPVVTPMID